MHAHGAMGTIGMREMIIPTLLRGNAAQDAPRPLFMTYQAIVSPL